MNGRPEAETESLAYPEARGQESQYASLLRPTTLQEEGKQQCELE